MSTIREKKYLECKIYYNAEKVQIKKCKVYNEVDWEIGTIYILFYSLTTFLLNNSTNVHVTNQTTHQPLFNRSEFFSLYVYPLDGQSG